MTRSVRLFDERHLFAGGDVAGGEPIEIHSRRHAMTGIVGRIPFEAVLAGGQLAVEKGFDLAAADVEYLQLHMLGFGNGE